MGNHLLQIINLFPWAVMVRYDNTALLDSKAIVNLLIILADPQYC